VGFWDSHNWLYNLQYGYLAGLDTKHTRHASNLSSLLIRRKRNRNQSPNRHAHNENQETTTANLTSSVVLSMKTLRVSDVVHRELGLILTIFCSVTTFGITLLYKLSFKQISRSFF